VVQVTAVAFISQLQKLLLPRPSSIMVALLFFLALLLPALLARTYPVSVKPATRGRAYSQYGVPIGGDVTRFVVKYANAQRWEQSTAVPISQVASLFQQVPTFSSYLIRPSLTSPIYRTFLLLAPSPAQPQRLRTAFIWLFTFPTPSVLAATLPLSSGSFTVLLSFITRVHCFCLSGFMVVHL